MTPASMLVSVVSSLLLGGGADLEKIALILSIRGTFILISLAYMSPPVHKKIGTTGGPTLKVPTNKAD